MHKSIYQDRLYSWPENKSSWFKRVHIDTIMFSDHGENSMKPIIEYSLEFLNVWKLYNWGITDGSKEEIKGKLESILNWMIMETECIWIYEMSPK